MNPLARLFSFFKRAPIVSRVSAPTVRAVVPPPDAALPEMVALAAESQLGVRETGDNKGAALQAYFGADDYDPNGGAPGDDGYPWCAAFVCWCIMTAIARLGIVPPFSRPRTAAAFGFEKWANGMRGKGVKLLPAGSAIKRGDIVIFRVSHVGVAVADAAPAAEVVTVDGNTNDDGSREGYEVARRKRKRSTVRSIVRLG